MIVAVKPRDRAPRVTFRPACRDPLSRSRSGRVGGTHLEQNVAWVAADDVTAGNRFAAILAQRFLHDGMHFLDLRRLRVLVVN